MLVGKKKSVKEKSFQCIRGEMGERQCLDKQSTVFCLVGRRETVSSGASIGDWSGDRERSQICLSAWIRATWIFFLHKIILQTIRTSENCLQVSIHLLKQYHKGGYIDIYMWTIGRFTAGIRPFKIRTAGLSEH